MSIIIGNESEFLSADGAFYISTDALDSSKFIVTYQDANDSGHGVAKIGDVNGSAITFGSGAKFLDRSSAEYSRVASLSDDKFVVVYRDFTGSDSHGLAKIGAVSGTDITFGPKAGFMDSQDVGQACEYEYQRGGIIDVTDAQIRSTSPDTNFGSTNELILFWGHDDSNIQRIYIEFDISNIPSGEFVRTAELDLTSFGRLASSGYPFTISRVTQSGVTESGVTWNNYDGGSPWDTPGGDYSDTDAVHANLPTSNGLFTISGLRDLALDAIQNRDGKLRLIFTGESGVATFDGAGFRSSEYFAGADRPKLRITTGLGQGTTIYTQTDIPADCGAITGCSDLTVALGAGAVKAIEGASPGTTGYTATIPKNETRAAFMFEIVPDQLSAWVEGSWYVSWKIGNVLEGGGDLTWEETWICRINDSCTAMDTIAVASGQGITLAANTSCGVALNGVSQVHSSGDKIYVIIGIKNANSFNPFDIKMIPSLTIGTPIIPLIETDWFSPTEVGTELTDGAAPEDDWTLGENVKTSDDQRAKTQTVTDKEDMGAFGITVPNGAVIYGLTASVEGQAAGNPSLNESAVLGIRLSDNAGSGYTSMIEVHFDGQELPFTDEFGTYGGPDNDWGHGIWFPNQVIDGQFRCRMEFSKSEGAAFGAARGPAGGIDHVKIKAAHTYMSPQEPVPAYIDVTALSESGFVVVYSDVAASGHGKARVGLVNGTDIIFGDPVEFLGSVETSHVSVSATSSSGFIVVYRDGDDSDHGTAKIGVVSGTTITFGNEAEFLGSGAANHISVTTLEEAKFAVAYRNDANSYHGAVRIGDIDGTEITFGDEYEFLSATCANYNSIETIDESRFLIAYTDTSDSGHGTIQIGTVDGTDITFSDEIEFLSTGYSAYNSISLLDPGKFAISYQDLPDSNHGTTKIGSIPIALAASGSLVISGSVGPEVTKIFASGDLFISGSISVSSASGSIDLYIAGHQSDQASIKLFIGGLASISGTPPTTLFVSGHNISFADCDLFIGGHNNITSSGDLFIEGVDSISSSADLCILGHDTSVASVDLFLSGFATTSGLTDLFVGGKDNKTNSTDLFIGGFDTILESVDLFIGGKKRDTSSVDLFIRGADSIFSSVNLYTLSHDTEVVSIHLFLSGFDKTTEFVDLFIGGKDNQTSSVDLFIGGLEDEDSIPSPTLFIRGYETTSTSGVLFAEGKDNQASSADLFIGGKDLTISSIDLYIFGHDVSVAPVDLFLAGFDVITESVDLFIGGIVAASVSHDLFIEGKDTSTLSCDLFIHGHTETDESIDLVIAGHSPLSLSGDLFIGGQSSLSTSTDLLIVGHDTAQISGDLYIKANLFQSDEISLYISGSGIIHISDNIPLFINGFIAKEPVSCPILDPNVAIQIPQRIITLYQDNIDALINQLGKNTLLNLQPEITDCPNCQQEMHRQRSTGVYKIGGPRPFRRGRKCPYCYGNGFLETHVQKCIKCLVKWNPRDYGNYGISVQKNDAVVRLKTYLTNMADILEAETAIVEYDEILTVKLNVRKVRDPIPIGLREDRYCISFWELV